MRFSSSCDNVCNCLATQRSRSPANKKMKKKGYSIVNSSKMLFNNFSEN